MRPLSHQLQDRYTELSDTSQYLRQAESEELSDETLVSLGIDFNPLDISTGATSPWKDFPSCRDMIVSGGSSDPLLKQCTDQGDSCPAVNIIGSLFHVCCGTLFAITPTT